MAEETKDLTFLGVPYQKQLVKVFLEDKDFFKTLNPIVNQNMFTDATLRTFVGLMKDYYSRYRTVPSYTTMDSLIRNKGMAAYDREVHLKILSELRNAPIDSPEYVKDLASNFFKQQNIIRAASRVLEIANKDNDLHSYQECLTILQKALKEGEEPSKFEKLWDDYEDTFSREARHPIPTGIDVIDNLLQGGIGVGELGMLIAPTGKGKTSMTTAFVQHAATYKCAENNYQGYKVVQIFFEDTKRQIRTKHFSKVSNIEACMMLDDENVALARERTDLNLPQNRMLNENVRIRRYSNGSQTVDMIRADIEDLENEEKFRPDLITIDYFECLKYERTTGSRWDAEEKTMRRLEAFVNETGIPIWVCTQGNRDSLSAEILTSDKNSGAFAKNSVSHIIIGIARTTEDAQQDKCTISLNKNRAGRDTKVFSDVKFYNGTCTFDTSQCHEFRDMTEFQSYQDKDMRSTQSDLFEKAKARRNQVAAAQSGGDEAF